MSEYIIEAKNLTKYYVDGKVNAINGVDLSVKRSEFLVIRGPSGCGKSTLLYLLSGLDRPTSGEVSYEGKPLKQALAQPGFRVRNVGFVFQLFYLWPALNVLDNVLLPLFDTNVDRKASRERAISLLELVGLSDKTNASVRTLSVGQRQRVAIARALIAEPKIIFADEPTGSLDSRNTELILRLFSRIHKERNVTVMMATHQHAVDTFCDRIIEMVDGVIKGH